jgi:hypothetical protein
MKPARIIRICADLAAVVATVRAESKVADPPPMTPTEVQDQARAFVEYRRVPRDECVTLTPLPGAIRKINAGIGVRYSRIMLQKSFCTGDQKILRPVGAGTPSPHAKLTGDFGNTTEVIRIGDCFLLRIFATNS